MAPLEVLAAPFFAASVVLVCAGVSKLARPGPLIRTLRATGLSIPSPAGRAIGLLEVAVGGAGLIRPARGTALAIGAVYLIFAVFLARLLLARIDVPSCGCSTEWDVPPSWFHVVLDATAAGSALAVGVTGPSFGDLIAFAGTLPLAGVPFVLGVFLLSYLASVAGRHLPSAMAAYRSAP
jgi:uncharacterized membrane protein